MTRDNLKKGDAYGQIDLGDPVTTSTYGLCIYDETAGVTALVGSLAIAPNTTWADKDPKGWLYKDKTGAENGVIKVLLKPNDTAGKTKVKLKAKGVNIPMPTPFDGAAYFDQDTAVTVQLVNSDTPTCWSSEFTTAKKNTGVQFKAKSP